MVSPDGRDNSLSIHQNAYISRRLTKNFDSFVYQPYEKGNGVFLFVMEGSLFLNNNELLKRDSATIANIDEVIEIKPVQNSYFLIIEVPV